MRRNENRLYLREWRKHRMLTQERLAARAGVTQGLISQLETGRTDYTGSLLERLSEALQCEVADLLIRNPLDTEAPWSIWQGLPPTERRQAVEILKALKKTSAA